MKARHLVIILVIAALSAMVFVYMKNRPEQGKASILIQDKTTESPASSVAISSEKPAYVSVTSASFDEVAYLEALGAVKAKDQIKVLPQSSGQLTSVNVREGDYVKTGDTLFVIGGTNGREHPSITQSRLAETNYKTAQKLLAETIQGNNASIKASELQIQSAKNQAAGSYTDLAVMDRNLQGLDQGYELTGDTYERTSTKNRKDLDVAKLGLDQLRDGINTMENRRYDLEVARDKSAFDAADSSVRDKAIADFNTKIQDIDGKLNDMYSQLDTAKIKYDSAVESLSILENQVQGQIVQTETQRDVLSLNRQGIEQKLGLTGGSSDPVRLAEVALEGARVKNEASLAQAKAAVELARLNYEMSMTQLEGTTIKAPVSGVITDVGARPGDIVSPQAILTSIIDPRAFELKVSIDADSADRVNIDSPAQIKIGGKYVDVHILSISPVVDSQSKLVTVTLSLPKIMFRPNQTIDALIPISLQSPQSGPQAISIPLDAVIIGTEEQYLFVLENGKALKRTVKLGEIDGANVQIIEGLSSEDRVIVDGAKDLIDGQAVEISK